MKLSKKTVLQALALVMFFAVPAFAGEKGASASMVRAAQAIGAALSIGIAAAGAGIGQGLGIQGTQLAIARNPAAAPKLTTNMFIGLALIEALAIYALVISFILLFVF